MPRKGRDRLARPRDVYEGLKPDVPSHPVPGRAETFQQYEGRLDDATDPLLVMLIKDGYGTPSQREYLLRLGASIEVLNRLRAHLHKTWKET